MSAILHISPNNKGCIQIMFHRGLFKALASIESIMKEAWALDVGKELNSETINWALDTE